MALFTATCHSLWWHYRRHPLQAFCLLAGVVLGVALYVAVLVINAQARSTYDQSAGLLGSQATHELTRPDRALSLEDYISLRNQGLAGLIPIAEAWLRLAEGERIRARAVDPVAFISQAPGTEDQAAGPFSAGFDADFMLPPWRTLIDPAEAGRRGWQAGESLLLENGQRLPPLAFNTLAGAGLWLDLGAWQQLQEQPVTLQRLQWRPDEALLERFARLAPEGMQLSRIPDPLALRTLTDSFHQNLNALGLLAFAVGLFICVNAARFSVIQRRHLQAQLRQFGVPARTLGLALALENLLVVLLGGGLGLALGALLAAHLMPLLATTLGGLYGIDVRSGLRWEPGWLWQVAAMLGLAWCIVTCSQWLAARSAATALIGQTRAQQGAQAAARRDQQLGLLGGFCLLAAIVAFFWLDSKSRVAVPDWAVMAAFAITGLWLLAAALLLPLGLRGIWRPCSRVRPQHALWQWLLADARFQASRCNLAMMAFLLALAANIGMVTMVGSFRQALNTWLDQRVSADLIVQAGEQAEPLREWLARQPSVHAMQVRYELAVQQDGREIEVLAAESLELLAQTIPLAQELPEFWSSFAAARQVSINEQMARFAGLLPGDRFTLDIAGQRAELEVGAIHYDYGNTQWQILLSGNELQRWFPEIQASWLGIYCNGNCPAELQEALQETFSLGEFAMLERGEILALSNRIFNRTFAITTALQWLTLAVSILAVFLALLAIEKERAVQLASLRAWGVTRVKTLGMAWIQTGLFATATALLALPFGFGLAYLLVNQVNELSFGWTMPLTVQPVLWLQALTIGLLAMLLAAAIPAWRLGRLSVAQLLKRRVSHV